LRAHFISYWTKFSSEKHKTKETLIDAKSLQDGNQKGNSFFADFENHNGLNYKEAEVYF